MYIKKELINNPPPPPPFDTNRRLVAFFTEAHVHVRFTPLIITKRLRKQTFISVCTTFSKEVW